MNKEGFTLVELIAVIAVIALVTTITIMGINNSLEKSREKKVNIVADNLLSSAKSYYAELSLEGEEILETIEFTFPNNYEGLEFKGEAPDSGHVKISPSGSIDISICIKDNCVQKKSGCEYAVGQVFEFDYNGTTGINGSVQNFEAKCSGKYQLEVWGAKGGDGNSGIGGLGGYSTGTFSLTTDTPLYVVVGGRGVSGGSGSGPISGGYNGGGGIGGNGNVRKAGAGGGATHISGSSGLLNISAVRTNIYIVASGGGGGSGYGGTAIGGYGGGSNGGSVIGGGTGGTPSVGGTSVTYSVAGPGIGSPAGYNADGTIHTGCQDHGGAGGGGWYGGGSGKTCTGGGGGGGGSSYIGSAIIGDMIAGNITNGMPNPRGSGNITGNSGHGFARITYLG